MTGKQIHSIVHRLEVVGRMREDVRDDIMCGNASRARGKRRAADQVMARVYRDLGRWMSHKQYLEFGIAEGQVSKHREHAFAKRFGAKKQPVAA